ncbi:MAG: DUF928 domain-containing protein [Kovacikia sp.]
MIKQWLRSQFLVSTLMGLIFSLSCVHQASAQATQSSPNPGNHRIRYQLKEPPPTGNPPQTSGAGNRGGIGSCPIVNTPLTALVPKLETSNGELIWGRTTEARPTVWIYVPYALSPKLPGELRLREQDVNGKPGNTTIARVTQTSPGVIGLRLPSGKALKVNQTYYWSFVVLCDLKDSSANQFVKAAIQRVATAPSLAKQLQTAQPLERAALYARAGLWYDALTQVAGLRQSHPREATFVQDWQALLADGGLDSSAMQEIVRVSPNAQ